MTATAFPRKDPSHGAATHRHISSLPTGVLAGRTRHPSRWAAGHRRTSFATPRCLTGPPATPMPPSATTPGCALVESGLRAAATGTPGARHAIYLAVAHAVVAILSEEPASRCCSTTPASPSMRCGAWTPPGRMFKAAGASGRPAAQPARQPGRDREAPPRRPAPRRRPSRPLHPALPALARRAQRLAERGHAGQGAHAQPLHDRPRRGGDARRAAWPPRRRPSTRSSSSTPAPPTHDRDRPLVRRPRDRARVDRLVLRRAQRLLCARPPATGSCTSTPTRCSSPRTSRPCAGLTRQVWREAFYLLETSYTGEEDDGTGVVHNTLRVFRNRDHYRFEGRLHEQVTGLPHDVPGRIEQTTVRVQHYGYLGSVRDAKAKSQRNIELLRAQQARQRPERVPALQPRHGVRRHR